MRTHAYVAFKRGAPSLNESFRRQVRGGIESQQWSELLALYSSVLFSTSADHRICDLNGEEGSCWTPSLVRFVAVFQKILSIFFSNVSLFPPLSGKFVSGGICPGPGVCLSPIGILAMDKKTTQSNPTAMPLISSFPTIEESADEHEICDGFLAEKEQQLLLDEEALRETLEEEAIAEKERARAEKERARAEKEWEKIMKDEQAHDELFRLEFGVKSDSKYESD
nr:RNA-directed DNA polymerase, eukaryota, reverse transcriptase zinc-binding domain protein [Tanacetum cinerariifolium]